MSLVKTSFLNGIAVVTKIATSILLNKILAVYVGPSGYGTVGQFQNAVSIIVNLAGGVVATGVTKATAQHFDNESRQHAVWRTAIRLSLGASLVSAIVLLLVGNQLALMLLHRADMSSVFIWLALSLPAIAANNMLLAIVNGKKEVGIYVTANIIGSLVSILVVGLLAINFGLYGTLVAFTITPAIVLLSTAALVAQRDWLKAKFLWGQMDRSALLDLSGFGLMGLTSATAMPVTFMLIRDHITTKLGLNAAGYWQASWKISEIYLMLVTTTLAVYYLPRLAEIRTSRELKAEIIKVYRFVLPIVVITAAAIYLLRSNIINSLFTADFLPMQELFFWQLTGDVMKISSWVLSYILLSRAMVKLFIFTEILFSLAFVFLSWKLVDIYGLVGVSMAYFINYSLYWLVMAYSVKYEMRQIDLKIDA